MQVTDYGGIRMLSREEVIEELSKNPEAEIYGLDGRKLAVRRKVDAEDEVEVFEVDGHDPENPPAQARSGFFPDAVGYARR